MFKGRPAKSIAIAVILSATGVITAQADTHNNQVAEFAEDNDISKYEAKKIVKDYLKTSEKYNKLSVGGIRKLRESWKIVLKTARGVKVSAVYVDNKTGEITFKR